MVVLRKGLSFDYMDFSSIIIHPGSHSIENIFYNPICVEVGLTKFGQKDTFIYGSAVFEHLPKEEKKSFSWHCDSVVIYYYPLEFEPREKAIFQCFSQ